MFLAASSKSFSALLFWLSGLLGPSPPPPVPPPPPLANVSSILFKPSNISLFCSSISSLAALPPLSLFNAVLSAATNVSRVFPIFSSLAFEPLLFTASYKICPAFIFLLSLASCFNCSVFCFNVSVSLLNASSRFFNSLEVAISPPASPTALTSSINCFNFLSSNSAISFNIL